MSLRLPLPFLISLTALLCQCGENKPTATKPKPIAPAKSEMITLGLVDAGNHVPPYSVGTEPKAPTELSLSPEAEATDHGDSEQLSKLTTAALKAMLASPESAPEIQVAPLLPNELQTTFQDQTTQVRRWQPTTREVSLGLNDAFASLLARFAAPPRVHLKPIGIQTSPTLSTQVLVELAGLSPKGHQREIHSTWRCDWVDTSKPSNISLEAFEETSSDAEPWFVDITRATVLAKGSKVSPALIDGSIEYWTQHITRYGDLFQTGHHGLAVGDVNGDGIDDVYVCDGGSLPNQLYIQQADGTVTHRGLGLLEDSRGALLIDLDNDGDQDLVVCTVAMIAFSENDGGGNFTLKGGYPGVQYGGALSAADPDLDGDLDLYICVYEGEDTQRGAARGFQSSSPYPFHDATNGGRNVLLENLGNFEFIDSTERFGLEMNNSRWSFAASWEDIDRDGDPDLYVANDFGRNHFYRNDDGKFTDIADRLQIEDMAAGMSVSWGDYNRDGAADLYVGNMFSSAGRRISYQDDFVQGRDPAALLGTQRMARGNSLFKAGTSNFEDTSELAGVTMGRWAWSSAFADLNNDGWEDLLVANGYLTNRRDDDL